MRVRPGVRTSTYTILLALGAVLVAAVGELRAAILLKPVLLVKRLMSHCSSVVASGALPGPRIAQALARHWRCSPILLTGPPQMLQ